MNHDSNQTIKSVIRIIVGLQLLSVFDVILSIKHFWD